MQSNFLVGSIPQSFAKLMGVKKMDISQNKLSGKIPEFLTSFSSAYYLNLSFNNFYGEIPVGGVFSNASVVSIEGNDGLCAWAPTKSIRFCSSLADKESMHEKLVLALKIAIPFVIVSITLLCVLVARSRKGLKLKAQLLQFNEKLEQITYEDIVKATKSFSSDNLIGSGSFGMVYKGNLEFRQDQVAIKIFNLDTNGANRSFVAECEALRNVRLRNIIQIITSCSSVDSKGADIKALVFKYMKNGNLEMWLHPKEHEHSQRNTLMFSQRVNIVLDVAFALDYLHNRCVSPLIHCDLKPSNILLDLDMVAYVTDFGSARFLCTKSNSDQERNKFGLPKRISWIHHTRIWHEQRLVGWVARLAAERHEHPPLLVGVDGLLRRPAPLSWADVRAGRCLMALPRLGPFDVSAIIKS